MHNIELYQWLILILATLALVLISPVSKTVKEFFQADVDDKQPNFWLLTSSLVISWIFAKSITNAANLGLEFGMVGGVAYAAYYLSFLVAGVVIYRMRVRGGFSSIHQFLRTKFGRSAVVLFSLLIGIRLFNEVWSNTMVIGSYFGEQGSGSYYAAILVFTALTLAYSLKGGLRSSLLTDLIQMALFGVLLFIILGVLIPKENNDVGKFAASGEWTLSGGINLLLVALVQVFSYPFHDPVLTDRGFIAPPKTTLKSYIWATITGFACITLFSFVGIYGSFRGMEGQAAVEVSRSLGVGMMLVMNFIMITSAGSTLDSAFASFSKLTVVDLGKTGSATVSKGRWAMVAITVIGTIPVFLGPEILSATTISGTMVLGLAPVFLFWNKKVPKLSFHLPVWAGIAAGLVVALGWIPPGFVFLEGKFGDLLSVNLLATGACFLLFFIPVLIKKHG
jgi:solute:Na+ symporter, SSS family